MNAPLLVAFAGRAGAGKDTAGGLLRLQLERIGYTAHLLAFADPLRAMLGAVIPSAYMTERGLKEQPIPGLGYSYRELAQKLGTEWGRQALDPDIWVRFAAQRVEQESARPGRHAWVLTDCRFPNEFEWLRSMGGFVVRLRRDVQAVREHVSETAADDELADIAIDNRGTLQALHESMAALAPQLVSRWQMQRLRVSMPGALACASTHYAGATA